MNDIHAKPRTMARRHYNLPPLTTLAAFEAAARHLSFKEAAQELNVTAGAVSHQIKALEGEIGLALFDRLHRGVALTPQGEALFAALRGAFHDISRVLTEVRRSTDDKSVTICATSAVSSLWLTPRIGQFWRDHPDIAVNQIVSDRPMTDLAKADLFISYGAPRSPLSGAEVLFKDMLQPVCAPELANRIKGTALADLAQERLIHLDSTEASWTNWQHWFAALGYGGPVAKGLKVNNYMIALQAAQDGAGLVLGWQRLIDPLLKTGMLVALGPHTMAAPELFYIAQSDRDNANRAAATLKNWLLEHR
ncbi:MAG: LysR substrate-binding domain-containing protein [Paracoccaceae bacterium]